MTDDQRVSSIILPDGFAWYAKEGKFVFDNKAIIQRKGRPDLTCHIAVRAKIEDIPPEGDKPGSTKIYDPDDAELKADVLAGVESLRKHI